MTVMDDGTEFGGYRIERLLGSGGFCNVYLAEDLRPALKRKVALKVLNPTLSSDEKNRERFQRESLLAVELDDHPNIVGVLDAGEQDGQLFIAQRYIEGRDLGKTIEENGPLTPERAVEVMTEIAGALDAAHEAGLVHRDVKPRNILIRERDNRCFLADFGLTKRTAASDSLTGAGEFLGTFAYAAPEQLGGQAVDGRADIYALGCVLFESLTGAAPFSGDIHSMITSHLTKAPPPVAASVPGLPPAIDAVIQKAMAKEPDDRYQTGAEFAEATRRALLTSGLPPPVAVTTPPPPPPTTTVSAPAFPTPPTPSVDPSPTPPPGGTFPPSGPPAATGGGKSKTPLLIGGAVLLVAVIAGALLLGGGDGGGDDPPEPTPTTVDEEAVALEEAQAEAEDAFDEVTGALDVEDCELGEVEADDDGVVAEISCGAQEGADELAITVFDDEGVYDDAYEGAQEPAAQTLDTSGDCATDIYAAHSWTTADEPDGVAGSVACYRDGEGGSGIAWTDNDLQILGVATRNDESDALLYNWWADLVGRSEQTTVDEFPNALERELLTHVPTPFRATCIRAELRPTETASVQCFPPRGASTVFYNQYRTAAASAAVYNNLIDGGGVARDSGESTDCPFEGPLTIDEQESGRVACFLLDDGSERLVWVNRGLAINAEASIADDADLQAFWNWWTTAGPIP